MATQQVTRFDPFTISLTGINAVEASAGTGKTYGIASIYARIIILENKNVEDILVVTFTNAAVAELRQRLRNRLMGIKSSLLDNNGMDPFISRLLQEMQTKSKNISDVIKHLNQQLNHFDEAAIYTIHSFCMTILKDEAFLSGTPFNINLVTDHKETIQTFTGDFFRKNITSSKENSWLFLHENITPDSLYHDNHQWLQKPLLNKKFIPEPELQKFNDYLAQLRISLEKINHQIEPTLAQEFQTILAAGILKGNLFKSNTYQSLLDNLQQSQETIFSTIRQDRYLKACNRLRLDSIEKSIKKGTAGDDIAKVETLFSKLQPLVNLAELIEYYEKNKDKILANWYLKFIDDIDEQLQKYKQKTLERSFDDLLTDVFSILQRRTSHTQQLVKSLNQKYRYVLIDEFQDTDPIQYSIFQSLFIQHKTPIFFVGDPKQSIYQFRGANINTYLKAKQSASNFYSMDTNYRSVRSLITAINHIFSGSANPFKIKNIPYYSIKAHRNSVKIIEATPSSALTIIKLNDEHKNKDNLNKTASQATANKIVQLLNDSSIKYNDRPLQAKDIAILVNTHIQAKMISDALSQKNIRSIKYEKESIYQTQEATTLLALLKFTRKLVYQNNTNDIQQYQELNYLLSSELWNYTASEISQIWNSQDTFNNYLTQLREFFNQWQTQSIYSAFQFLSQSINFEKRLIQQQQERTLTNFNQLIELIAEQEILSHSSATLIKWLEEQIQAKNSFSEENTLRLESDEDLVKIVTIHASKGLQYPIVFCPFIWNYSDKNKDDSLLTIIDQPNDSEEQPSDKMPILTYRQKNLEPNKFRDEEALRLVYVALTRAEEKLILFIENRSKEDIEKKLKDGKNESLENPLQYLISPFLKQADDIWSAWQAWYQTNNLSSDIVTLQDKQPNFTEFTAVNKDKNALLSIKKPSIKCRTSENTSFSQLHKGLETVKMQEAISHHKINLNNSEKEAIELEIVKDQSLTIFNFPGGSRIGNFWHELLEIIEPQKPIADQEKILRQKIIQYGISKGSDENELSNLINIIQTTLENTLSAKLNDNGSTITNFPAECVSKELEFMFYYPVPFALETINHWLKKQALELEKYPKKNYQNIYETYVNGFIDWLGWDKTNQSLYIIDYKSNFIGKNIGDYHSNNLLPTIKQHHYQLQATIYALAMYRYFKSLGFSIKNIYIRYLFLRGLAKDQHGIWQWDITDKQIQELNESLQT